jgi:hypothetical protein
MGGVDRPIDPIGAGIRMAVCTVETQAGRDNTHTGDEVVNAQFLERARGYVLEGVAGFHARHRRRHASLRAYPDHHQTTHAKICERSNTND